MAKISISSARETLPASVDRAQTEAVFIERHGRPAAVLISAARYDELMEAYEEAEDIAAFDVAMAEEGPSIPWEEVKIDLGWT